MGRDSDPDKRHALLEQVMQYLLEHGLHDLSLRPLAGAIGTNARMLIYHFGSKERMIVDALELTQAGMMDALAATPPPKASAEAELIHLWRWFTSDAFVPFSTLLLQVEAQALAGNAFYRSFAQRTLRGWAQFVQTRFERCDATTADLIVGTVAGLLLDRAIREDDARTDAAFERFARRLAAAGDLA